MPDWWVSFKWIPPESDEEEEEDEEDEEEREEREEEDHWEDNGQQGDNNVIVI